MWQGYRAGVLMPWRNPRGLVGGGGAPEAWCYGSLISALAEPPRSRGGAPFA